MLNAMPRMELDEYWKWGWEPANFQYCLCIIYTSIFLVIG